MNWELDWDDYLYCGIDVFYYQGEIDWWQVVGDDVVFVYIKVSEGGDFKDGVFLCNWLGVVVVGLLSGVYYFFSLCKDGVVQVCNFLFVVVLDLNMFVFVLDFEFEGNCLCCLDVGEVF